MAVGAFDLGESEEEVEDGVCLFVGVEAFAGVEDEAESLAELLATLLSALFGAPIEGGIGRVSMRASGRAGQRSCGRVEASGRPSQHLQVLGMIVAMVWDERERGEADCPRLAHSVLLTIKFERIGTGRGGHAGRVGQADHLACGSRGLGSVP